MLNLEKGCVKIYKITKVCVIEFISKVINVTIM